MPITHFLRHVNSDIVCNYNALFQDIIYTHDNDFGKAQYS